jgi:hypothetical protein
MKNRCVLSTVHSAVALCLCSVILLDFTGWLSLVSVVTFDVDGSFCVSWFSTQVWSYFWHCITTNDTYGTMFIEKYYELIVSIHDSF